MIENTIDELEAKIRAETISNESKQELLQLLETLKSEAATLKQSNAAHIENQRMLKRSVEELRSSMEGFEKSHPKLVQAINSVSNLLSNLGI